MAVRTIPNAAPAPEQAPVSRPQGKRKTAQAKANTVSAAAASPTPAHAPVGTRAQAVTRSNAQQERVAYLRQCRWFDNVLAPASWKAVHDFIAGGGWQFGWQSMPARDRFAFWHKHYAGATATDHHDNPNRQDAYDCADELKDKVPLLRQFWDYLAAHQLKTHTLVRCYANAYPYGCDGTLHTDSGQANSFTTVYYPNERWSPNWGGETVLFTKDENDVLACCYPKPNRLFIFPGILPHVGRGVTRSCPALRMTLMFKTELRPILQ